MDINWESNENHLPLNPRLPRDEYLRWQKIWQEAVESLNLQGCVGILTSGSQEAKLVVLDKAAFLCSAKAVNTHLQITKQDLWLQALPDFHVGGLSVSARAHLAGFQVEHSVAQWEPVEFVAELQNRQITLTSLVPTQVFDLVSSQLRAPNSLRAVVVGGGALAPELYQKARHLAWPLLPSYGMTETASQVATAALHSLRSVEMPAMQVLAHAKLQTDEQSRIGVQSQSLLRSYLVAKQESWECIDPKNEGWFWSEDYGQVQEGHVQVWGRGSDFIKISGENVNLLALENRLVGLREQLPHSCDAALVAVPDERLGYTLHLLITSAPAAADLVELFHRASLPFERVRQVHVVSQIPRTTLGKLQRAAALALVEL